MLIDKGVTPGEVVTIRLSSGEELITKLVEETDSYYKVNKPMLLSMSQQGIGMMPFLFTVNMDKDLNISKSNVVVVCSTASSFADQYIQGTTGIAMR
jgi:hypothetical protein